MKKNSANTELNEAIFELELKRAHELAMMKTLVFEVRRGLHPMNLLKSTLEAKTVSHDVKSGISTTIIGLATGTLVKKILFGKTHNPIMKAAGAMVQTAVVGLVANNSDKINLIGRRLIQTVVAKLQQPKK